MTDDASNLSPLLILDAFNISDLKRWETQKNKILRYHWDLYSALAFERHKITSQLRLALLQASEGPYEFKGWQRQVRYKYALSPLSPKGSLLEPGGRFNLPYMDSTQIVPFLALYIAEDKETTLQEAGQLNDNQKSPLSPLELALIKKESISIISVRGVLNSVIDLSHPDKLQPFVDLIKRFQIPKKILQSSKKLRILPPVVMKNVDTLLASLLEPNWRAYCIQLDVPANCQIFGQLVANAGIEGIIYPSKFTAKKCLAIYPQNFDFKSFAEVDGEGPQGAMTRLDAITWPSIKATL